MLLHAIPLDASMPAAAVLSRFARHGLWLDDEQPQAKSWIEKRAHALGRLPSEAARLLARDPSRYGAAIRRQWGTSILWYSFHAGEVLSRCAAAPAEQILLDVLNLHESDSRPPLDATALTGGEGVVLHGGIPVAVSKAVAAAAGPRLRGGAPLPRPPAPSPTRSGGMRSGGGAAPRPATEVHAWPKIDAPQYVPALQPFTVTVGLSAAQQDGVSGGRLTLTAPAGVSTIDVSVELAANGLDAISGWTRMLSVRVDDPTAATVTFDLVGRDPVGPEPVHLATLEVRYVLDGSVCGVASRPIVIGKPATAAPPAPPLGASWLAQPASSSELRLTADPAAADLTIELMKPDRNPTSGSYVCRLVSPHAIDTPKGPFPVELGDDAKTFAQETIERLRQYGSAALADNYLRAVGELVAEKLPPEAMDALREVAQKVAPEPPAVLIASAEPFVPWELAVVDPPLDASRPPYLGAQAMVGRWFRDTGTSPRILKPPAQPPNRIPVAHMAVMAGKYKATSGLRDLPAAEAEAAALVKAYDGIPLAASPAALKQLLDAELAHGFTQVGAPGAVHFAGHGQFDATVPDSSVLFLSDGAPVSSMLFRSAKYGGDRQPFIFLNACMVGLGGEVLGDMGGFPGNCLRGGFGAVLGALWAVDDAVASAIATEFWSRALPPAGSVPEPVGAILQDIRTRYAESLATAPATTYLAYTYYGHPRLVLERAS